jgi:hypothetical protein
MLAPPAKDQTYIYAATLVVWGSRADIDGQEQEDGGILGPLPGPRCRPDEAIAAHGNLGGAGHSRPADWVSLPRGPAARQRAGTGKAGRFSSTRASRLPLPISTEPLSAAGDGLASADLDQLTAIV